MNVTLCDRCNAEVKTPDHSDKQKYPLYDIRKTVIVPETGAISSSMIDLCEACRKQLKEFVSGRLLKY